MTVPPPHGRESADQAAGDLLEPADVTASLLDLRGLHAGASGDFMIVAHQMAGRTGPDALELTRYSFFQTPCMSSVSSPLASALAAAYVSFPPWVIPVGISGAVSLPSITKEQVSQWMGDDGGFSSLVYAFAYHVKSKLRFGCLSTAAQQSRC